jgi:hypothetical protein
MAGQPTVVSDISLPLLLCRPHPCFAVKNFLGSAVGLVSGAASSAVSK